MSNIFYQPKSRMFTNDGQIGAGYKFYFYQTGTTTSITTYSDPNLTVANTNPVIADEYGYFNLIYVSDFSQVKVIVKDADDNLIYTADPVNPSGSSSVTLNDLGVRPTSYWGLTSGTATAYILSANPTLPAYSNTNTFFIQFHVACGNSPTLNINNLGSLNLKKYNLTGGKVSINENDLLSSIRYIAINDGVDIVILNPQQPYFNSKNLTQATFSENGVSYSKQQIVISNNAGTPNTILDFSAGNAIADDGSVQFTVSALSKNIQGSGSWAPGNNQNGLDTGTRASNTPYYCFAIYNPATLASDILISASFNSPTLPSGYTKKSYIGSIGYTDASSNIRPFRKQGNYTYYLNKNTPDYSVSNYGTSQIFVTLLVPLINNITSYFIFDPAQVNNATDRPFFCKTFSETNASPNGTTFDILMRAGTSNSSTPFWLPTTNGQIWYRGSVATDANSAMVITTKGWFDYNLI